MKYLICLTALGLTAMSQNFNTSPVTIQNSSPILIAQQDFERQEMQSEQNAINRSPYQIPVDYIGQRPVDYIGQPDDQIGQNQRFGQQRRKHHRKNGRNHHHKRTEMRNADYIGQSNRYDDQSEDVEYWRNADQQNWRQYDEEYDGPRHRGSKGKLFCHIFFFVLLSALSFCLIKKCIQRRRGQGFGRCGGRFAEMRMMNNPNLIDQQINKHQAQIQRLTEMKNSLNRRVQGQPIIYQQMYPQQNIELGNMGQGRFVNQNYFPRNGNEIQFQQIPVGRPISNQPNHLNQSNQSNEQVFYRANGY